MNPLVGPSDTLRVSELALSIQAAMRRSFPRRVWVVGEVAELERSLSKRNWFFTLAETSPADGRRYSLGAVLWPDEQRRLFGPGGTVRGAIEPKDGIEIRALVSIDFYAPYGALRLVVHDVDPAYTLGKLALERRLLIERLTKEGVLARQQRHVLTDVPLSIGLISSADSAAYSDFVRTLEASQIAFRILFVDARMQGEDTTRTVVTGLRTLARRSPDVIVIARGGGSVLDLSWFDKEDLVRAVADSPFPVLTGIGHEIDTSVADLAAHRQFKTPTAVAGFLVERAQDAMRSLDDARRRLRAAGDSIRDAARGLREDVMRLRHAVSALVQRERAFVGGVAKDLVRLPIARLLAEAGVIERGLLRLRMSGGLDRGRDRVQDLARRLVRAAMQRIREHEVALESCRTRVRLLDPAAVLRRGYALLEDSKGRVVTDARRVSSGDRIVARMRDGQIAARVERVEATSGMENVDGEAKERRRPGRGPKHPGQLEIW
ncbi:MAG: exodeoxyribonuclease VII large subunit [Planctomycetes bacterium]|nr:exodeoxyribonuclease VII large subunit [Planctomycetota bacterium]